MRKIIVFTNLTLDGVMQAPGRPDEDLRDDFKFGGWGAPYAAMTFATGESMSNIGALLFGRRTYEDFYKVWPNRSDNPYTEMLNNSQKYVASTTLKEPLPWVNSTLLKGDVSNTLASLKAQSGKDFLVMGSGVLVQSLMQHNLVDILCAPGSPAHSRIRAYTFPRRFSLHSTQAYRCQANPKWCGHRHLPTRLIG